jgi:hypothetical protein
MKHILRNPFLNACAVLLSLAGCTGEDPASLFSPTPAIELIGVSPGEVVAFRDSIVFEVSYEDGDGDLGSADAPDRNLFIEDNRIQVVHELRIQQLAPDGANISIKGIFTAILPQTIITDGTTRQAVNFTLYVRDRAGHESNRVTSRDIFVVE